MHGRQLTVEVGYRGQGCDAVVGLGEQPGQGGGHGGSGESGESWIFGDNGPGSKDVCGEGGERGRVWRDERRGGRGVESHGRPTGKRRRGQWTDDAMIVL